ncbi:hypothetical protein T12_8082 [Trichinella patagoniensis]|uniref:Uncharacterized protein n=1 Tax=Trichinella patagoniensis TaxID=990121 RepID=A0A0V0ZR23_9BILA|nr:hypothetical protein T12_8082 [Trichinella patagoniensis]
MLPGVTESFALLLCLVFPSPGINSTGVSLYIAFHRLTTWQLCLSSFSVSTLLSVTKTFRSSSSAWFLSQRLSIYIFVNILPPDYSAVAMSSFLSISHIVEISRFLFLANKSQPARSEEEQSNNVPNANNPSKG